MFDRNFIKKLTFGICFHAVNAWVEHYDEGEDDERVIKVLLPILACAILSCIGCCYFKQHCEDKDKDKEDEKPSHAATIVAIEEARRNSQHSLEKKRLPSASSGESGHCSDFSGKQLPYRPPVPLPMPGRLSNQSSNHTSTCSKNSFERRDSQVPIIAPVCREGNSKTSSRHTRPYVSKHSRSSVYSKKSDTVPDARAAPIRPYQRNSIHSLK